jgi:predicted dithiol-disulfide oxidoreductase (DUF899 family)
MGDQTTPRREEATAMTDPKVDRAPKGRNESGSSEFWLRRHDEY